MEITYEKFLEFQQKEALIVLDNKEEVEGKVLGCRNDESGNIRFLLVDVSRELKVVEISQINYIIPNPA